MTEYPEADKKIETIRSYAREYGIRTFVETGTGHGYSLSRLIDDFDELYSVELDPESWAETIRPMFENEPKVSTSVGDSGVWLQDLLEFWVDDAALFWLDAHYCGGARAEIDTPIRAELHAIFKGASMGSVILIDDARLFGGMSDHTEDFKDWPEMEWIADTAWDAGYGAYIKDDIIRLTPYV